MTSTPLVAQTLGPGVVALGPQGAALVGRLLADATRRAASDGIGLPPQARELLAALEEAERLRNLYGTCSHARSGTSEPAESPDRARCLQDVVGVEEVAQMLEVSPEYARRLCRVGEFDTARKVGRVWRVDRLELQAWQELRQEVSPA